MKFSMELVPVDPEAATAMKDWNWQRISAVMQLVFQIVLLFGKGPAPAATVVQEET